MILIRAATFCSRDGARASGVWPAGPGTAGKQVPSVWARRRIALHDRGLGYRIPACAAENPRALTVASMRTAPALRGRTVLANSARPPIEVTPKLRCYSVKVMSTMIVRDELPTLSAT